jgi:hypothetical protein
MSWCEKTMCQMYCGAVRRNFKTHYPQPLRVWIAFQVAESLYLHQFINLGCVCGVSNHSCGRVFNMSSMAIACLLVKVEALRTTNRQFTECWIFAAARKEFFSRN